MNDITKSLLLSFLLLIVFLSSIYFLFFTPYIANFVDSMMGTQWEEKSLDLGKFNQNPESYLQKHITVMGKVYLSSEFYINCNRSVKILQDEESNQIKICESSEDLQKEKTYTLKGTLVKDISNFTKKEGYILKLD